MEFLLTSAGITYEHPDFQVVLFILLLVITALRLIFASLHKLIYKNPLDFNLEKDLESTSR